jgi:UDP-N-acetylglucosamine:LPS N-acetylglucosamine transferase
MRSHGDRPADEPGVILLVASSGGHLIELLELADPYPSEERHWVTFDKPDARSLLADEIVTFAWSPTNRSLRNLVRNTALAVRLLRRLRPRAVITTGAGVAVPFLYAGRVFGARTIYVESLARIERLSLTGRLVYPVVTAMYVQWPELAERYRRARYAGAII